MAIQTLNTFYISELRDLYNSENQLVKSLPKMVKQAESQELSKAFADHLEETKNQVARLEQIFASLEENPKGKKCVGMEGILKEATETIAELQDSVRDVALISGAQRVEHYEIAAYGTACAYAELLQRGEDLGLLKETLEEEKRADEKLTELSETINREALEDSSSEVPADGRRVSKQTIRLRKHGSAA
jgi:ferritin-like metal-binding protein YciE